MTSSSHVSLSGRNSQYLSLMSSAYSMMCFWCVLGTVVSSVSLVNTTVCDGSSRLSLLSLDAPALLTFVF